MICPDCGKSEYAENGSHHLNVDCPKRTVTCHFCGYSYAVPTAPEPLFKQQAISDIFIDSGRDSSPCPAEDDNDIVLPEGKRFGISSGAKFGRLPDIDVRKTGVPHVGFTPVDCITEVNDDVNYAIPREPTPVASVNLRPLFQRLPARYDNDWLPPTEPPQR